MDGRLSVLGEFLLKAALIILLYSLLSHCWRKRWFYFYGAKIPGYSGFPFLGSIKLFINSDELYYNLFHFCKKFKPIGKFWIGSDLAVLISDPEYVTCLAKKCLGKSEKYNCLKEGFGEGILTAPVDKWKRNRHLINKTFKYNILCSYMHIFIKYSDKLVEDLKRNENIPININEKFNKCTFAIIHESCMGVDWSETQEYAQYMHNIERGAKLVIQHMLYPFYQIDLIWNMSGRAKLKMICKELFDHARKVLKYKKNELKNNNQNSFDQHSFLNHLIKSTEEDGVWSDEELIEETQTMIAAGSDTSAITLSFLMVMLAAHPEIQEKVFEEQRLIFKDGHETITLADINKMEYLDRVLKETMRLFPIAPYVLREISENVKVGNYTLPKGTTLFIPVGFIHKDPTWWPDPLKFNPDRFLPEEIEKRPRYTYMPFSIAPRNCIGFQFAYMSMKVIMSSIIRRYRAIWTSYKSVEDVKLKLNVLAGAKDGYNVILTSR